MIGIHLRTLSPKRALLVGAFSFLVIAELLPFCYPLILAQTLDQLQGLAPPTGWTFLLFLYLGVVLFHSSALFLRIYLGQRLSTDCNHRLRKKVFGHLQGLPVSEVQKVPVGQWISRVTNDTEAYGNIFSEGILELASNLALLLFSIGFMLFLDWRLALATMVTLPAMLWVSAWYRKHFRTLQFQFREALGALTGCLQESLNGVGIVQIFRGQKRVEGKFLDLNRTYMDYSLQYAKRYAGFFPLIQSLSDLSLVACYAMGLWLISAGDIRPSMLVAFAWYASIYSRPLRDISERINSIQTALAAGDRVRDFLSLPMDAMGHKNRHREKDLSPIAVSFQDVHFEYERGKPVLKGTTFQINQGSRTALVGRTGCGKSTALQLMIGFLESQEGQIRILGEIPRELDQKTLRSKVAWLPQEPFLFSGSLRENICLGLDFDPEKFRHVAEQAQILNILEQLPMGDQTQIGSGGMEISSGQKQLVAYARALYQNPEILLLDEPSSSIDPDTGHKLESALVELLKGRTALIVAHRLSSVLACETVLVMDKGQIVERGDPKELLKIPGSYFSLLFGEIP